MEKRNCNITFNKSGNGYLTPRLVLPISWVKEIGVTPEDREVEVYLDGEEIRIRKAEKQNNNLT